MTERGLLLKGPLVIAAKEERETATRRVILHQPQDIEYQQFFPGVGQWIYKEKGQPEKMVKCPYGAPGDRLRVRETFATFRKSTEAEMADYLQAAKKIKTMEDLMAMSEMPSGGGNLKVLYAADFGEYAKDPDAEEQDLAFHREIDKLTESGTSTISANIATFGYLRDSINAARGFGWDANPWVYRIGFRRVD